MLLKAYLAVGMVGVADVIADAIDVIIVLMHPAGDLIIGVGMDDLAVGVADGNISMVVGVHVCFEHICVGMAFNCITTIIISFVIIVVLFLFILVIWFLVIDRSALDGDD